MHIELDGGVWRIVEFQHVKPGKGGAFVRTKLKSFDSGAVVDRTFRAGEKFARVRTETKDMQYLYDAGDEVVFMDQDTYEQTSLPHSVVEDALEFMLPSGSIQMLLVNGEPSGVQLPASVELAVSEREAGRGVQQSLAGLDWVAAVPGHFLHVSAPTSAAEWHDVAPFTITYRGVNCFHDAAIVEAHPDPEAPLPPSPFLPHLSIGYFRR